MSAFITLHGTVLLKCINTFIVEAKHAQHCGCSQWLFKFVKVFFFSQKLSCISKIKFWIWNNFFYNADISSYANILILCNSQRKKKKILWPLTPDINKWSMDYTHTALSTTFMTPQSSLQWPLIHPFTHTNDCLGPLWTFGGFPCLAHRHDVGTTNLLVNGQPVLPQSLPTRHFLLLTAHLTKLEGGLWCPQNTQTCSLSGTDIHVGPVQSHSTLPEMLPFFPVHFCSVWTRFQGKRWGREKGFWTMLKPSL